MKIDPIIAVKNIASSAAWYTSIFGFRRTHEGDEFAILVDENDEVMLCLHKWNEHDHPTMKDSKIAAGNGLILYFRTKNLANIRANAETLSHPVETEIALSPNSGKEEFSLRDLDGYYLTVSAYHNYQG